MQLINSFEMNFEDPSPILSPNGIRQMVLAMPGVCRYMGDSQMREAGLTGVENFHRLVWCLANLLIIHHVWLPAPVLWVVSGLG